MKRDIEREGTPKPLQYQLFFDRLEHNLRSPAPSCSSHTALTPPSPSSPGQRLSSRQAELKRLGDQQNTWVRRRHKSDTVLFRVQECLKALHSLLDPQHTGYISGKALIAQLLSLGLSTDPGAIVRVICAIYGERDIQGLKLTLEQMLELSKVDRVTDKMLALLSGMAGEAGGTGGIKRTGTSLSPSRFSRVSEPAATPWRDGNMSLSDYLQQLKKLWGDICGPGSLTCELEHMSRVLTQLNIFADMLEVRKAFPEQEDGGTSVTFQDFQDFFAKSMFKGALVTLAHRLAKGIGGLMTPKMVISLYQRRLLLAGLHGAPNLSREEGQTTLRAVEEYSKQVKGL